jgi:hypothetical protein
VTKVKQTNIHNLTDKNVCTSHCTTVLWKTGLINSCGSHAAGICNLYPVNNNYLYSFFGGGVSSNCSLCLSLICVTITRYFETRYFIKSFIGKRFFWLEGPNSMALHSGEGPQLCHNMAEKCVQKRLSMWGDLDSKQPTTERTYSFWDTSLNPFWGWDFCDDF